MNYPKDLGYYFPCEWHRHEATWLTYPHNEKSWPGKIETIFESYHSFIAALSNVEKVHINIENDTAKQKILLGLSNKKFNNNNIFFHKFLSNDAWIRDHGPAFVINKNEIKDQKAIINWNYNAWGGKYPCELDNKIPNQIAEYLSLPQFFPNIIMEGGSVEFNGQGDLITTESCLLNQNRNPLLNKQEIENYLRNYYGVENIIWLSSGIQGDDTDGHIDDLTRFVNKDTLVSCVGQKNNNEDADILTKNISLLKKARLLSGKQPTIVELPLPDRVIYQDEQLPASYANFYIANDIVIVPIFKTNSDDIALRILEQCFDDRQIIPIDSRDIIWGLGSFHCLSQQEPSVKDK